MRECAFYKAKAWSTAVFVPHISRNLLFLAKKANTLSTESTALMLSIVIYRNVFSSINKILMSILWSNFTLPFHFSFYNRICVKFIMMFFLFVFGWFRKYSNRYSNRYSQGKCINLMKSKERKFNLKRIRSFLNIKVIEILLVEEKNLTDVSAKPDYPMWWTSFLCEKERFVYTVTGCATPRFIDSS